MFDFLVRDTLVSGAQKFIDRLNPKANIHIPKDLPIPSIGIIKSMSAVVSKVNGFEAEIKKFNALSRNAQTNEEREGLAIELEKLKVDLKGIKKIALDDILPEAFAIVREASKRTIGLRHFDVQLIGGMV